MTDAPPQKPSPRKRLSAAGSAALRWGPVRWVMLGRIAAWMLPTPSTFYFNAVVMPPPPKPVDLPDADWTRRESHALLDRSEDRRRTIETKGPGLATVSAILVAGVLVALSSGWEQSTWPARLLLGGATFYALISLLVPIHLVGPLRRQAIRSVELTEAANQSNPETFLALKARAGAAINDHDNLVLTNLQGAARKEAWFVWALLVSWALLVPLTGIGERTEAAAATDQAPITCLVATNPACGSSRENAPPIGHSSIAAPPGHGVAAILARCLPQQRRHPRHTGQPRQPGAGRTRCVSSARRPDRVPSRGAARRG
jgi:hypothetical protein